MILTLNRLTFARSLLILLLTASAILSIVGLAQANENPKITQAKSLIKSAKAADAIKLLSPLKLSGSDEALRLFHLARAYAMQKKYSDAEMANLRAIAVNPKLYNAYFNNICYMTLSGNEAKAVEYSKMLADSLKKEPKLRSQYEKMFNTDPDLARFRKRVDFVALRDLVVYGMPKDQYQTAKGHEETTRKTASMVNDKKAQKLVDAQKLNLLNLTWEDTGRYKDSSVGPNISDMTIQVGVEDPESGLLQGTVMPVIRHDNFSDKTADIDPKDFTLLVGNEKGAPLKRISLYDFLETPTEYLSKPKSWKAIKKTLLANRDKKVLVSAQACFLPVPSKGKATFNPVLFNYQSRQGDPAVLTVLATPSGSSTTIIDNQRDGFSSNFGWGQRLFFNDNGQRASLTGERKKEFIANRDAQAKAGNTKKPQGAQVSDDALNMVLLIQIPLKQKQPTDYGDNGKGYSDEEQMENSAVEAAAAPMANTVSNVDDAVIGFGKAEGPFTEIDDLEIQRDERFPVRVTVQFYKATSNGVVSERDIIDIRKQIDLVYAKGDYVGSLVTDGETGRITEYEGPKKEPKTWWVNFWKDYEKSTGIKPDIAMAKLRKLLGNNYESKDVTELYVRDLLRGK